LNRAPAAGGQECILHIARLDRPGNFKDSLFLVAKQGGKAFGLFENLGV